MRGIFLAIGLASLVTGCSGLNGNISGSWDCPAQKGRGCISISDADELARHGGGTAVVSSGVYTAPKAATTTPAPSSQTSNAGVLEALGLKGSAGSVSAASAEPVRLAPGAAAPSVVVPPRTRERVASIYFFPFVDAADAYHDAAYVHATIVPSEWVER
ncbi:type IV conjugative transfer system lipoprotein TraV [Azospirillum sp. A23]|uniref:type IV conjugative transfer system lipoprotein TraV n=1 Tax=Azospirillum sp. A23 TaxID=3160608 RepID=UPI0036F23D7A